MNARHIAEVASWTAFHSDRLIFGQQPQSVFAANPYWIASKCRQQRWMTSLKMFQSDLDAPDANHNPWPAIEIVVQEIFVSEMLTRVWSAAMIAHDCHHHSEELRGVAHSVHLSHIEAKNRAMRLLLTAPASAFSHFEQLNLLRGKVERWTDLLLGQLSELRSAIEFAFQPNRVGDFHEERRASDPREWAAKQPIYSAALSEDLFRVTSPYSANPMLNRQIATGILACFPSDRFDSVGLPKSAQILWIEKIADDTQLLADTLNDLERPAAIMPPFRRR
jgi:hypothetical protein